METKVSVREFIQNYEKGIYDDPSVNTMIDAGWFDWFCDDEELKPRLDALFTKVTRIAHSAKIDMDTMFFKNNCPVCGALFDDFRFCEIESDDVVFTVIPASGHDRDQGLSEVWGRENNFECALAKGNWHDVQEFFSELKHDSGVHSKSVGGLA
jgi:hypothetical protein